MSYQYSSNVDNGLRWMEEPYEPIGRYTAKTFGWMALGLLATFGTAFAFYLLGFYFFIGLNKHNRTFKPPKVEGEN